MDKLPSLVQSTLQAFGNLVSLVELEDPVRIPTIQSHFGRFKLWVGSLEAHRTSGTRSLVYRLRDASAVRSHVVSLLEDLNGSLSEAISRFRHPHYWAAGEQDNAYVSNELAHLLGETENDSGDGSEYDTWLARLLRQVGGIIDCLLRLSATIGNPAPYDQFKSRVDIQTRHCESYDIDHVREKYPKLDPAVHVRLGKALTQRRAYFKYREDHHLRLQGSLAPDGKVKPGNECGETTVASKIPRHLSNSTIFAHNSLDDASSEASATSYALSTHLNTLGPRVPPLPKDFGDGPFLCPFCFTTISVDSRHDWKKHVFRDLRPYVCVWNDCVSTVQNFQKRRDWISHMTQEHWRHWDCPFGCSTPLDDSRALEAHLKSTHAENLDTQWATATMGRSTHINLGKVTGDCPLCRNFEVESIRQYASHVGNHLEVLALFALPKTEDYEDEAEKDKGDNIKHQTKISEPEAPYIDNANESPVGVKPQTSDMSSESGPSFQGRLEEGTSPEISMSQSGTHSEMAMQHFTQSTKAGVVGTHPGDSTEQEVYPNRTKDGERNVQPRNTETQQPHERDERQPIYKDLSTSLDRFSISAEGSTQKQRPPESLQRSSVRAQAGPTQSSTRPKYVQEKKWVCPWCDFGPLDWTYDSSCVECGRQRDMYARIEYRTRKN